MSKKKSKSVTSSGPVETVLRVGDQVTMKVERIAEYGTDRDGPYAIVELGDPLAVEEFCFVKSIDVTASEEQIRFSVEPPIPWTDDDADGKAEEFADRVSKLPMKPSAPVIVRENLLVKLTDGEKIEVAKTAALLVGEVANKEEELKQVSQQRKSEIKALKADIDALTRAHNTGVEFREVQCEQQFDLENQRTWFVYRGETYGNRAMNSHEIRETQKSLFGDAPNLPNKIDPESLPHPSKLAGDELAKKAAANGVDSDTVAGI